AVLADVEDQGVTIAEEVHRRGGDLLGLFSGMQEIELDVADVAGKALDLLEAEVLESGAVRVEVAAGLMSPSVVYDRKMLVVADSSQVGGQAGGEGHRSCDLVVVAGGELLTQSLGQFVAFLGIDVVLVYRAGDTVDDLLDALRIECR